MKRSLDDDTYEFTLVIGKTTHVLRVQGEHADVAGQPLRTALATLDAVLRSAKLGRVE